MGFLLRGSRRAPVGSCFNASSHRETMRKVGADFSAEPAEFNGQDNHMHLPVTRATSGRRCTLPLPEQAPR